MQAELDQAPANIVHQARLLVGENQRTFAKRVRSAQPLICKYETGKVSPPADVLIHCMHLLGASPAMVTTDELAALVKARLDGPHMQSARLAVARLIECLPPVDDSAIGASSSSERVSESLAPLPRRPARRTKPRAHAKARR